MKQTYILAISGGVDSMVLLHKLAAVKPEWITYVVAHVNHGIRSDAARDEQFVRNAAAQYGYAFYSTRLNLGEGASEALAREKRYEFLFDVKKQFKAESIITAHHQDDVLETMIVHMLRGTTARGLIGYQRSGILRPFLNTPKQALLDYANKHHLTWHEDETNSDESYLRNYVRAQLMPKLNAEREKFLNLRSQVLSLYGEIDTLTSRLLVSSMHKKQLMRSRFVILPYRVQKELIACWLRLFGITFDAVVLEQAVLACKVLRAGKKCVLTKNAHLLMQKNSIVLIVE